MLFKTVSASTLAFLAILEIERILNQLEPCQCTRCIPRKLRDAPPLKETSVRGASPATNQKLLSMCVCV